VSVLEALRELGAEPVDGATSKADDAGAWQAARSRGVGGSDLAAILGQSPYRTALDVYVSKVSGGSVDGGGSRTEGASGDGETEAMYWGTALEPVVLAEFKRRKLTNSGATVVRVPMLRHRERPWQVANLDGLVVDADGVPTAPLEVKTAGLFNGTEWHGEEIPAHALLQLHHYLSVTGLPFGYLAALIGGQRFEARRVDYDGDLDASIIAAETAFWQRVQDRRPPPLEPGQSAESLVRALYPTATEDAAELDGSLSELIEQYRDAHAAEVVAKARKTAARDALTLALGPHSAGTIGGRVVCTFKDHDRRAVDLAWLKEQRPDVYAQACRVKPVRTFRLV
jgi:putative phage-type endonuclease